MKILLVDDDSTYRHMIGIMLRDRVSLVYAETLTEALNILGSEQFDCVLLDANLPDSIPTQTVKTVMDRNPDANILVISGSTDPETISAAVKAGAHAYLHKGVDDTRSDDLLRVLKDAVVRRKARV